jgi:hypothetical protein
VCVCVGVIQCWLVQKVNSHCLLLPVVGCCWLLLVVVFGYHMAVLRSTTLVISTLLLLLQVLVVVQCAVPDSRMLLADSLALSVGAIRLPSGTKRCCCSFKQLSSSGRAVQCH